MSAENDCDRPPARPAVSDGPGDAGQTMVGAELIERLSDPGSVPPGRGALTEACGANAIFTIVGLAGRDL
jgi:hypothetical protein